MPSVPRIIEYASKVLKNLPDSDTAWRSGAAIAFGDAHGINGEMKEAYPARLEALDACRAGGDVFLIIVAQLKPALISRQQGRLRQTVEICRRQVQYAEECGISQTAVVGGPFAG